MRFAKLILLILITSILTSCGGMIARMHRDMDADLARREQGRRERQERQFEMYRKKAPQKQDKRMSTRSNPNVNPSIQRYYESNRPKPKKRYKASDLTDNSQDASLWSGSGNDNYLYSSDKVRQVGDIVLVNVQTKLRNEITMELKRVFPPARPKKKKNAKGKKEAATPPPQPEPAAKEETKPDEKDKIHDRFTGIIIEEVNRDHVLIKAQKNLLYNKYKHLIEIQALASRKDIMPDDTIDSNDFLEVSIEVLR